MSAPKSDPVGFLAACHEADNRASTVLNLLHKDVQHRHFVTGTEVLVNGLQDGVALPIDKGIAAQKAAATYKREKSLIYAAFLVVGTVPGSDGSERSLCAPIVYYPASLEKTRVSGENVVYLTADCRAQNVNFSLFAELLGEDDGASEVLEKILARVPVPPFDEVSLSELMHIFRDFVPHADVDALYRYPKLIGERGLRKAHKDSRLACLPSAMMALVSNPPAARGVLFELAETDVRETYSAPTRDLFGENVASVESRAAVPSVTSTVPAALSRAQQKVLTSARKNPLTLIVGPPGTGKSYTVAAVAVDHIMRGESVLIACRTDRALDVIEDKLHAMLGGTTKILRGGSRDYVRELKTYLRQLLKRHWRSVASRPPRH